MNTGPSNPSTSAEQPRPSESEPWILPFDGPSVSLHTAGGKGANLARLAAGGFPVPPGLIVATSAYRAYLAHNDLVGPIEAALSGLSVGDPTALEAASGAIQARFAAGAVPPDLASALRGEYRALGAPPVAVRSSATAEDLPDLSFAGQQDTFLNVVGEEALLEAVVNCWSSLWTARAIGYRARYGIPHDDLALAVVVQEMVPAEASGVLFTADPLDGRRTVMVVEATLGLGEALVSGQVEPDLYQIDAASGRILKSTLGAKALSIRAQEGGGTVVQAEDGDALQALPDEAIADLARLGWQVAGLFGSPQDLEWAWAGGRIYLLQSRPITSLFPLPAGMGPDPLQVLFSFAAVQGVMEPITPLGRDAVRALFAGAGALFGYRLTIENQKVVHSAGERLWINITSPFRNRLGRRVIGFFLAWIEAGARQSLESLMDDPRLAVTGGPSIHTLRRMLPFALPVIGRLVWTMLWPEQSRVRFQQDLETRLAEVEASFATRTTLAGRVDLVEELIAGAFVFALPRFIPRFGAGMATLNMLIHMARQVPGGEQLALIATRGLPHNVTTQMDLALWDTARTIRQDPASLAQFQEREPEALSAAYLAGSLPQPAQAAVAEFLARYGMRGVGEIDLGRPRWREDPAPVMQTLQSYLRIEDPEQAPDAVFRRGLVAAGAAIDRLAEEVRDTPGGRLKAWRVRWAARRMRALAGLRESPKFWAVRVMGLVRAALLDSGGVLVEDGLLALPDDLFFLRLAELGALAAGEERDWLGLVQERRQAYAREQRRTQIPRLMLSDGQAFYEGVVVSAEGVPLTGQEGILIGSPVSPGVVEGPVRVVLDPHDAPLVPGEILVCPGTDPAWTPLFLVAGGLVMEVGGLMTHGSVVAREYGIPAVVGVSQATSRLQTGQRVRVDGTSGQVVILEDRNE